MSQDERAFRGKGWREKGVNGEVAAVNAELEEIPSRAWAEVDLEALRHNAAVAQGCAGKGVRIMAVVKAAAYGHGLRQVVRGLRGRVDWFGVANAREGVEVLQESPEASVVVLGPLLPEERRVAAERGLVVCVSTPGEARALQELGRPVRVHLAVDTGMGRMGCLEEEVGRMRQVIEGLPWLILEGVATHLPRSDEDEPYTREQLRRTGMLFREFGEVKEAHVSNSAGLLKYGGEQGFVTMHRPGLMLYGVSPLAEYQETLRPVMALKARITLVRRLPPGRTISYGGCFVTVRDTLVATVGIGYGDGYPRQVSMRGAEVLAGGRRCALLGWVTMDQIMVDVSRVADGVELGDEVVLFGEQGGERILVTEVAEKAGTISWEVLTGITSRVPRIYRGESG